jgi:hypothetical protein
MPAMARIAPNIINAVLFQITWFAAVLGAAHGITWWGLAALGLLGAHVLASDFWRRDLTAAGVCVLVGGLLDTGWVRLGILDFGGPSPPGWILMLWAAVGLSLNSSLSWFRRRPVLGGVCAACSAPLSYSAGAGFGAAVVLAPFGLAVISASWLVFFWALFSVTGWIHRSQLELEI